MLFKSVDGGLNWINIKVPESKYRGNFMMSPENSEVLYASFSFLSAGGDKVLISQNAGIDWALLATPSENAVEFDITRLYLDPTDSRIFYANLSTANNEYQTRLAKSHNSGETWQVTNVSPYVPGEIMINRHNNQQLLMAYGKGVLRSENGGLDWLPSNNGIKEIGGILTAVEGQNNEDVMYIADPWFGFYHKSSDSGKHWQAFRAKPPLSDKCYKFQINPVYSREIICQTRSGLFISDDAGNTWKPIIQADSEFPEAVYAPDGKAIYLFFSSNHDRGLSKSTDNGLNWEKIPNIINDTDIGESSSGAAELNFSGLPIIDPRNSNILYTIVYLRGHADEITGLYKSTNAGKSWQLLVKEMIDGNGVLIMHPLNLDRLIFFIGQKSYWLSDDGGGSWEKTLEPLIASHDASVPEVVFDPDNLDGLFWSKEGVIYHSTDQGVNWSIMNQGLEAGGTLLASANSVFIFSNQGIYKLSEKIEFSQTSDCLFRWAEYEFPNVFKSESNISRSWEGYTYRYYEKSNTYLGFLYEQEIHFNQANLSSKIDVLGSVDFYRDLTGCD